MDKYLQECLTDRLSYTGSVLPFFWQHGEEHEILRREMDAIKRSGATEFCVESRTHEEFCREKWWEDFRFMLEYAREHDMKVWLLDDKRFPSGYANGYIEAHPILRRKLIRLDYRDFTGPTFRSQIYPIPLESQYEEQYISITAWKRAADFRTVVGEPIDLMNRINEQGLLEWEVPAGTWRVYYVIETKNTLDYKTDYIDMLSPESCKAMIEAVYQPHYDHFAEYFGNTFRGFFSDEPSFANSGGNYNHKLGTEDLLLPWKGELLELIAEEIGCEARNVHLWLPCLWHNMSGIAPAIRVGYMNCITRLYSRNFTQMLGNWCKERGVLYIGHIIEDNNTHQRLGYGPGHFFRALKGQHMSGVDIVLNQMIPGNLDVIHTAPVCGKKVEPTFFHYALAKLGASCAHINPEMENRAMAEVFGAFGWAEGVGYMKYLADHMLISGINHFVPHAFSPKYPDHDCPPHFHAGGMNPQEKAYGLLTRYMQRMTQLIADGVHKADVAVFYNAEAEWAGGSMELFQETCKQLAIHQIDFDILPEDALESASVKQNRLIVNKESYGALIVPYSEILPRKVLELMKRLKEQGLQVVFEQTSCEKVAEGGLAVEIIGDVAVVPSEELAEYLRKEGWYHIKAQGTCPGLRIYCVERDANTVYLLFNESRDVVDTVLCMEGFENSVFYEGWKNVLFLPQIEEQGIRVKLEFGQAIVIVIGNEDEKNEMDKEGDRGVLTPYPYEKLMLRELKTKWNIFLCDAGSDGYRAIKDLHDLVQFNTPSLEPRFCGIIRYETQFIAKGTEKTLDLGYVGEIATVYMNGEDCGTLVAAPYVFNICDAVKLGKNQLVVEVVNSPAYREREVDLCGTYHPLPASGLLGPVSIG